MDTGFWVILALFVMFAVAVYFGAAEADRRRERWEWQHPPEDDVCREDDEDEQP